MRNQSGHFVIVGLDAYLALLETENVAVFMSELRKRLDEDILHVDYLLSGNYPLPFASRYEEARKVVFLNGIEETQDPFHVLSFRIIRYRIKLRKIHNKFREKIAKSRRIPA